MKTKGRHKNVSRTLAYTWQKSLRIVGAVSQWKRPTKRDDKNQVMDVIREDRRLTVREVGDMLEIGKSSVQRILSDLSNTKVCARWVSLLLHEDQMQPRTSASKEFFKIQHKTCTILRRIKMTLNRHHELRFNVVGVAPTVFM